MRRSRSHQWNCVEVSEFAQNTFNPIRQFVEDPELEPNADKSVISLSIGDPTVFGNLKPCQEILDAVKDSLFSMKRHGYIPSIGTKEARQAVAKYSSIDGLDVQERDVIMTCGGSQALEMCITVLANKGQNILCPRPGFGVYKTLSEVIGIQVKFYDLLPNRNWEVDLDSMERCIDQDTVAIIVNNPSNPCGSVYSKSHLTDILDVAKRYKLPIIADEIYEHFVFSGKQYHPLASLSETVPILSCSGLTKRFMVPGWRTGWIIIHDRNNAFDNVRRGLISLSQRIMGANALILGAVPDILNNTPQEFFNDAIKVVEDNANLAYRLVSGIRGLNPVMPEGAMYMMVGVDMLQFPDFEDDSDFAKALFREESVFCMPGKCFYYPNYFRMVLTVPQEMIIEACSRIEAFCSRYTAKTKKNIIDVNPQTF